MISYASGYELYHHGIKGQKWGIRRFQNPDGSLTPAGMKRYGRLDSKINDNTRKAFKAEIDEIINSRKKQIKKDKEELKTINRGVLDKKDPKVRKEFGKIAEQNIKDEKRAWVDDYGYSSSSFNLKYAIGGMTYYEIESGKIEDYVDWLIQEHNNLVTNPNKKEIIDFIEKEIVKSEDIINKFSNTPVSKLYEEAGGNVRDLKKDLSDNLWLPDMYAALNAYLRNRG